MHFFAELALFGILFVEGGSGGASAAQAFGGLAAAGPRASLGMPLTAGSIALAGHLLTAMTWLEAFLVGAILSPTDPTLVSSLLQREAVPARLRQLLAVESGLNDGARSARAIPSSG
ncbi:MAG: cation:proton antiporter [Deltaproteobacteria bacterium]